MSKRLGSHLNPSLVISTIALFAALGGGYAVAFKGSGTLQKGAANPGGSFTIVRTLNGFPSLQARCASPSNGVLIRFGANNTGNTVLIDAQTYNEATNAVGVGEDVMLNGDNLSEEFLLPGAGGDGHFHLSKGGSSKAQVSIDVRGNLQSGNCHTVRALALNTVE